ncbi:hypothetical protein GCM10011348_03250 [Marinobacterium nitratireducens]|uniref:Transposase DDE domain-containing protein n=1 Tax=Marinobacterium nitratireducens TaxID=518897 RepID=A0A917Z7P3_9GAMM|nr:hypothetical protein GCM10011348_03250 [Marinobacterium nitratireducens]
MTHCTVTQDLVPRCKGRKIEANFDGGDITSDAGVILLRQLDRELGLTRSIARKITDPRSPSHCRHQAQTMIQQRVYGLALGYEDLNDHKTLRHDLALQTAVDSDAELASQSTLCRFELNANRAWAVAMHEELVEQFIRSYRKPPKRLILDSTRLTIRCMGSRWAAISVVTTEVTVSCAFRFLRAEAVGELPAPCLR